MAGDRVRLPRPPRLGMVAGAAAGHPDLHRRPGLHRTLRLHGAGPIAVPGSARNVRRRLPDPAGARLRRSGVRARHAAVPVRLSHGARGLRPAGSDPAGGDAQPGQLRRRGVRPRGPAGNPAGAGRRGDAGRDGSAWRVRGVALPGRRYPDDRHLSRVVRAGQRTRGAGPGRAAARHRGNTASGRAPPTRRGQILRRDAARSAPGPPAAPGGRGAGSLGRLLRARGHRIRAAGGAAPVVGGSPHAGVRRGACSADGHQHRLGGGGDRHDRGARRAGRIRGAGAQGSAGRGTGPMVDRRLRGAGGRAGGWHRHRLHLGRPSD